MIATNMCSNFGGFRCAENGYLRHIYIYIYIYAVLTKPDVCTKDFMVST